MNIKAMWDNYDQAKKRWIIVGGVGAIALLLMFAAAGNQDKHKETHTQQDAIRNILTDQDTRQVGLDSLTAKYKIMEKESVAQSKEVDRLKDELQRLKDKKQDNSALLKSIDNLRSEINDLKKASHQTREADKATGKTRTADAAASDEFAGSNPFDGTKAPKAAPAGAAREDAGAPAPLLISSFSEPVSESDKAKSEAENSAYLPAGSILTGIIINGMDAPTGQGARKDPFPSIIRINKEAILPNRFTADIRECFMLVSGYGDLSSERAYLRGEKLSCVTDDGGVIETALDSYAVGEDGKVGIRGRLVSKQGQLIAKSLMAGFMSGVSDAFNVNPVPVLNTSPNGETQYQSVFSGNAVQGGLAKGASKAMDRVAQFYLEMAESIFPVIEVDAGRQIDIVVTNGAALKVKQTAASTKSTPAKTAKTTPAKSSH